MKILWTEEDFNIDNGYIVNYEKNKTFHTIHLITVVNRSLTFRSSIELHIYNYKIRMTNGGTYCDIEEYAEMYAEESNDIHFLLTEEEVYRHLVMEEI